MNLDSLADIEKIDKSDLLRSVKALSAQVDQAWREVFLLETPKSCRLADNILICGMGGSALGGRILDSLLLDRVRTPVEVSTEFHIPKYVNQKTLVILSSYSGNTAETLSCAKEALERGAGLYCITTGGRLKDFMQDNHLAGYLINPKNNPSGQPRMGLGYSIVAILAVLAKCEFISLAEEEIKAVLKSVEQFSDEFDISQKTESNLAKSLALKLKGKIPVLVSSEHLLGAVHALKNQLNENAKTFSALFDIPELNHHLMEGLQFPGEGKNLLFFVFFESNLFCPEVKRIYPVTYEVVEKNNIPALVYKPRSGKKLEQIFEVLTLGSFIGFYLAMLNEVDPSPIAWVDYFKERLSHL